MTGAASGIGRAITRRFVAEGARVIAADVDDAGLAALAGEFGASVVPVHCDVTDEAQVGAAFNGAGVLDVVVANAGRGAFGMIVDHDIAEFRAILDLCVTGVFLTLKHGGRSLRDGGAAITIASLNAIQPAAGMSAYCTAKAGVAMLTKVAAMELGSRGIRVNAIAPGLIETPATSGFFDAPAIAREFVENTTVGRYGRPDEVAALALFLASDEGSFASGGLYQLDGGASTTRYPDLPAALARLLAEPDPG